MKAITKTKREFGALEILDIEEPHGCDLLPDECLVQVAACAVCGTDIHIYENRSNMSHMMVPVIIGHEYSGLVTAVGSSVTAFVPGDRVVGEAVEGCGVCENCRTGDTQVCLKYRSRGIMKDGAMTEYLIVEERFLHRLPCHIPFAIAASAQPCAVAVHGVFDNCDIRACDDVIVFGPGIIGQAAAQMAKIRGAGHVFLAGTDADAESRLSLASDFGFIPINVERDDIRQRVRETTGREFVDVVIECSGAVSAFTEAISLLRKNGYLTLIGIFPQPFVVSVNDLIRKEINIRTSFTATWGNYEMAIKLLASGKLKLDALCKPYPYSEILAAIRDATERTVLKPIIIMNETLAQG